jgi:hypothetical protein
MCNNFTDFNAVLFDKIFGFYLSVTKEFYVVEYRAFFNNKLNFNTIGNSGGIDINRFKQM